MVYISRADARPGDGDKIKWTIGEKALFHAASGVTHAVTIDANFVRSPAQPDKRCLEVTFDQNGERYCVLAERVEPIGGWPGANTTPIPKSAVSSRRRAGSARRAP